MSGKLVRLEGRQVGERLERINGLEVEMEAASKISGLQGRVSLLTF